MFSPEVKRKISDAVQKILRETGNPELPEGEIQFHLHVDGDGPSSWADIVNSGALSIECYNRNTGMNSTLIDDKFRSNNRQYVHPV